MSDLRVRAPESTAALALASRLSSVHGQAEPLPAGDWEVVAQVEAPLLQQVLPIVRRWLLEFGIEQTTVAYDGEELLLRRVDITAA